MIEVESSCHAPMPKTTWSVAFLYKSPSHIIDPTLCFATLYTRTFGQHDEVQTAHPGTLWVLSRLWPSYVDGGRKHQRHMRFGRSDQTKLSGPKGLGS